MLDRGFGKPDQPIEAGDELQKVLAGIVVKFGA